MVHDGAARVVLAGEQHGGFQAFQQLAVWLEIALDIARHVLAFARQFEERVEVVGQGADAARRWPMASSSRLRSCITFWLFSGWLQKSGAEICASVWLSFCF